MSYEEHCNDFALYGDPMREHYDHEFNAQFDRFDGWGDVDPATETRYDDCPNCDGQSDCLYHEDTVVFDEQLDKSVDTGWDDVPF